MKIPRCEDVHGALPAHRMTETGSAPSVDLQIESVLTDSGAQVRTRTLAAAPVAPYTVQAGSRFYGQDRGVFGRPMKTVQGF